MRIHQDINSNEDLFTWTKSMIVYTPGLQCGHIDVSVLCLFVSAIFGAKLLILIMGYGL